MDGAGPVVAALIQSEDVLAAASGVIEKATTGVRLRVSIRLTFVA
jgi:hypothetical protein